MTPRRNKRPSWKKAKAVLLQHRTKLLRRKDVVGVDLGIKRRKGDLVAGPCIRLHVLQKLPTTALHPRRVLPKAISGIPIDIVECQFRRASCPNGSVDHRRTIDPLVGGCSIGRFGSDDFGTLGAIVLHGSQRLAGLSCAHVVGMGEWVRQRHRAGRKIGKVQSEVDTAEADACVFPLSDDVASSPELLNYGPLQSTTIELQPSDLPFAVELVGACSGRTRGNVMSLDFSGWIKGASGEKFVRQQMVIEAEDGNVFSRGGDSGGSVVASGELVAMLIAAGAPELGGKGLATPIRNVLTALDVALP